jgi:integrase
MRNQRRAASSPDTVNCTVRKYLTAREIEKLMDYARKHSRYGHRDSTMVLVTYRHGLRASEVCDLQWHQVELDQGRMHVRRAKNGTPSVHPIRGDEIRALRKLRRESPHHRLPPSYPEARQGRQDAFLTASSHAAACVRL